MDFEYTSIVHIESSDLRKMYLYVKNGGDFGDVFDEVMSGYDDEDYYNSGNVFEQVEKEILRRIRQSKGE